MKLRLYSKFSRFEILTSVLAGD